MSTYNYTLKFNDTEIIMLRSALLQMIADCDEQLIDGPKAPYWAHKKSAESVLKRLHDNMEQASGNNFF